ncbi:9624_t:CDS:2 [Cetraspora pellucida]|uniref:9624_t:CDS:1 n=1 Tax=Cetraspora pellucida TaxID=1433469 RepID=A0A9N8W081_9GLOM|nr:9624_t:CDS:2 [Cetraspora pellucida]
MLPLFKDQILESTKNERFKTELNVELSSFLNTILDKNLQQKNTNFEISHCITNLISEGDGHL